MSPGPPHCFDGFPHNVVAYADGEWEAQHARVRGQPYRITASFWPKIGSKIHPELPQHYGRCDEVAATRPLYTWKPRHCSLRPFERDGVCSILHGRQIVVVGDSTVFQTFLSFVHLLGGSFGKDVKHGYVTADLTASVCSDATRIVFIRSDLLLWTHSIADYHAVQRCDGFTILHPFVQRASRDADVVILGVGHHFPRALMLAEKWSLWDGAEATRRARIGFFARNLNHTLSSLLQRRAGWGRHDPASVVILGTSTPIRGCARLKSPLEASLANTLISAADTRENISANELRWMQYAHYNRAARSLASAHGVSFIDVAEPSARRPDGAMARFWPSTPMYIKHRVDCVHVRARCTRSTRAYHRISARSLASTSALSPACSHPCLSYRCTSPPA